MPEGVYTVAVANKGYGGSTEVEIRRGQTTVLDLEKLKGEGPKKRKYFVRGGCGGCRS